jgi:hypothetical protein
MLPHFLNYYSRIAARIVIYDNLSTDRSVEIAAACPGVEVFSFDTQGELSELSLMNVRNTCWKNDRSDYSIVCDIDEFLFAEDLFSFLESKADYEVFHAAGFDMVSDAFPSDYGRLITEQVKHGVPAMDYSKMVIFRPQALAEMNYGPGSHRAAPVGKAALRIYAAREHGSDLKLLHYKNLGFEHRIRKHQSLATRVRGAEYEKHGFGMHYRLPHDVQRQQYDLLKKLAVKVVPLGETE